MCKKVFTMDEMASIFDEHQQIAVFGAGKLAKGLITALTEKQRMRIQAILVSSSDNNPRDIQGIQVISLESDAQNRSNVVIVAVGGQNRQSAYQALVQNGFDNIVLISPWLESRLSLACDGANYKRIKSRSIANSWGHVQCEQIYAKNVQALRELGYFAGKKLPDYLELTQLQLLSLDTGGVGYVYEKRGIYYEIKLKSVLQEFLAQIDADMPINLDNPNDAAELAWMCTRLRDSNSYGGDNHLYVRYASYDLLMTLMSVQDWTGALRSEKMVFCFLDDEYQCANKIVGRELEKKLDIDEVQEIMHNACMKSHAGNAFFNSILDFHPNLLTVAFYGLAAFKILYEEFLKDVTPSEAIEHLNHPCNDNEKQLLRENLTTLLRKGTGSGRDVEGTETLELRKKKFFRELADICVTRNCLSPYEWFKAFVLAAAFSMGRKFHSRIAPAIYFDFHGVDEEVMAAYGTDMRELISFFEEKIYVGFAYEKIYTIVRDPITTLESILKDQIKYKNGKLLDKFGNFQKVAMGKVSNIMDIIFDYAAILPFSLYVSRNDERYSTWRIVRFEDLKLYPQETMKKVCEFFRLPWKKTILQCTFNGDQTDGFFEGAKGFDTAPVFKEYQILGALDRYRLALIHGSDYHVWGYKSKIGSPVTFSSAEMEKLISLPFVCEQIAEFDDNMTSKNNNTREGLLEVAQYLIDNGWPIPVDENGEPMKPVKWLRPQLQQGERLYE